MTQRWNLSMSRLLAARNWRSWMSLVHLPHGVDDGSRHRRTSLRDLRPVRDVGLLMGSCGNVGEVG